MYIVEYRERWDETGWVFREDAKLARERGLGGWVDGWFDGTSVLGGRGIGAGARFRWVCF